MGSVSGDDSSVSDTNRSSTKEERILVSVRFRPLNEKELDKNDISDWECTNNTTIVPKNISHERSMFPTSYTFDRVFGSDCSTRQVYEDAAKNVALSVVRGINASILAYGQTSSGKTYTMSGITEYSMLDIFDYVNKLEDRQFKLKFAAMEIYNECVRDLLSSDQTPLRILDDKERGIVVDKLTEVTLKDWSHLKELLSLCDAQRQIAETSLNEMSSRSHQILRLTVVNSARKVLGSNNSRTLAATVNFVDLAGSERSSQTLSPGVHLKEGCHINSSLLTLGSVIRRLSKGKHRHIPYRDSKLTRILQNSLGGNARTAIICTLSPAHSHVEQSRNTLLFASCAKKVSSSVKVNVVSSDKGLVKKLEKDLARMENELRALVSLSDSSHSASTIKEKERLIEQMGKEIRALTDQRDEAQSHLRRLLQAGGESQSSRLSAHRSSFSDSSFDKGAWSDDNLASDASDVVDNLRFDMVFNNFRSLDRFRKFPSYKFEEFEWDDQLLSAETPTVFIDKYFGPDPSHGWENIISTSDQNTEDGVVEVQCIEVEDIGKSCENDEHLASQLNGVVEVQCIEVEDTGHCENDEHLSSQLNESLDSSPLGADDEVKSLKLDVQEIENECDRMILDRRICPSPCSSDSELTVARSINISRCNSCKATMTTSTWPPLIRKLANERENVPLSKLEKETQETLNDDRALKVSQIQEEEYKNMKVHFEECINAHQHDYGKGYQEDNKLTSEYSLGYSSWGGSTSSEDDYDIGKNLNSNLSPFKDDTIECQNPSTDRVDPEVDPTLSKVDKLPSNGLKVVDGSQDSPPKWLMEFDNRRMEIIALWDTCSVPLVHRTYFFLLFKGDPSDAVYMEVEQRRLSFLRSTLNRSAARQASRALHHEREKLSRQIQKKFSRDERREMYQKWGIQLKSKKRRFQLCLRLWRYSHDIEHIKESAALVAKLVGLVEPSAAPEQMFGLSMPQLSKMKSHGWRRSRPSFKLL
ncbi:hypothetical protein LIER_14750 [Lithospermum erythrorhizon]|uniref:Kinesin-like protein n=1 Tax=Lithospermum erythrorhizon TaxID=34254 RepID=A0AAV3Q0N5_LITER